MLWSKNQVINLHEVEQVKQTSRWKQVMGSQVN